MRSNDLWAPLLRVLFLFLFSCSHFSPPELRPPAGESAARAPTATYVGGDRVDLDEDQTRADELDRDSANEDPTFEELRRVLRENPEIDTIAGLLARLSDSHPKYLSKHALAYDSLSLHGSSFENPRAVVFGREGGLILTFNGSPEQKAYEALELVSYDAQKGYSFRELVFRGDQKLIARANGATEGARKAGGAAAADEAPEEVLPNVSFSKPNPGKCLQCHGANPRPNWQPYFIWPGFYGSDDDRLFQFHPAGASIGRMAVLSAGGGADDDRERRGFEKYLRAMPEHPRYRFLGMPRGNAALYPSLKGVKSLYRRPNGTLTLLFSRQIAELLVNDVWRKTKSERNLIDLALLNCVDEGKLAPADAPSVAKWFSAAAADLPAHDQAQFNILTEDVHRIGQAFNHRIEYRPDARFTPAQVARPFEPAAPPGPLRPTPVAGVPPSRYADIVTGVHLELRGDRYAADGVAKGVPVFLPVSRALREWGLSPEDYVVNLRRNLYYQDGVRGPDLYAPVAALLESRKKMDHKPDCTELLGLRKR